MDENLNSLFKKLNINKDSLSPEMLNNLANMLKSNNTTSQNSKSANLDFNNILKIKSIMDNLNAKDNPNINLLEALKPYLKGNRKNKIDQYIQLMNLSKIIEILPFLGGDNKNDSK